MATPESSGSWWPPPAWGRSRAPSTSPRGARCSAWETGSSWGVCLFGGGLILLSLSRWLWLSVPLLVLTGFGMMTQMASSNTIIQTIVDEDKRGRVMSLYGMAFMGTAPFGSLLAGGLASRIGVPRTLMAGGALCLVGALMFARKLPALRVVARPIYVRLGILSEQAEALQAATNPTTPPESE